jgi:hypothetical protein
LKKQTEDTANADNSDYATTSTFITTPVVIDEQKRVKKKVVKKVKQSEITTIDPQADIIPVKEEQ